MKLIKIAVVGPESTGKTWLCERLAVHYQVPWVPEYARMYLKNVLGRYTFEDLKNIAKGQLEAEQKASIGPHKLLIVDTNMVVMKVWMEHAFGKSDAMIDNALKDYNYQATLLTNTDVPWQEDPLREHPHLREHFMKVYRNLLMEYKIQHTEITSSSYEERLRQAIEVVDQLVQVM